MVFDPGAANKATPLYALTHKECWLGLGAVALEIKNLFLAMIYPAMEEQGTKFSSSLFSIAEPFNKSK